MGVACALRLAVNTGTSSATAALGEGDSFRGLGLLSGFGECEIALVLDCSLLTDRRLNGFCKVSGNGSNFALCMPCFSLIVLKSSLYFRPSGIFLLLRDIELLLGEIISSAWALSLALSCFDRSTNPAKSI